MKFMNSIEREDSVGVYHQKVSCTWNLFRLLILTLFSCKDVHIFLSMKTNILCISLYFRNLKKILYLQKR